MLPGNQVKGISQRQKILIAITVVVFLIVAYNLMSLFRGSGTKTTTTTNKVATAKQAPGNNAAAAAGVSNMMPSMNQDLMAQPKETRVQANSDVFSLQTQTQAEYLNDLNNLQLLKIQKQIAETKQAIAAAKLATITTETNIADSLISARGPQPEATVPSASGAPAMPVMNLTPNLNYTLMSVSYQSSKWTAVIKVSDKLLDVSIGDILPDGSVVQSIDKNGVTIKRDTTATHLGLTNQI